MSLSQSSPRRVMSAERIASPDVAVVIVTYNRKALLLNCLRALRSQTQAIGRVFLIDNASTDGTPEDLRSAGVLDDPLVTYVRMSHNSGGAGGFSEGVRRAYDAGHEWLWLMDDDVEPEADCLAQLLSWSDRSQCIHPRKRLPDGRFQEWEQRLHPDSGRVTMVRPQAFEHGAESCEVNVGCFEGMLIHRRIVAAIGPPSSEYFIRYDDTIYGYKASLHTKVLYVRNAVLVRALPLAPPSTFNAFSLYYELRNRFLLRRDLKSLGHSSVWGTVTWLASLVVCAWRGAVGASGFKDRTLRVSAIARGMINGWRIGRIQVADVHGLPGRDVRLD